MFLSQHEDPLDLDTRALGAPSLDFMAKWTHRKQMEPSDWNGFRPKAFVKHSIWTCKQRNYFKELPWSRGRGGREGGERNTDACTRQDRRLVRMNQKYFGKARERRAKTVRDTLTALRLSMEIFRIRSSWGQTAISMPAISSWRVSAPIQSSSKNGVLDFEYTRRGELHFVLAYFPVQIINRILHCAQIMMSECCITPNTHSIFARSADLSTADATRNPQFANVLRIWAFLSSVSRCWKAFIER